MRNRFDNYEVHRIDCEGINVEDNPELHANTDHWGVMGHLLEGGVDCIVECDLEEDAWYLHGLFMKTLIKEG